MAGRNNGFVKEVAAGLRSVMPWGRKAYDFMPVGVQGRPQYPSTDLENLLEQYTKNEIVYAAINRKATAPVGLRLLVETRSSPKAEWQEEPGHPFRRLIMNPCPGMMESDFHGAFIVSSEVSGYFYAEKLFAGGLPVQLGPLNPAMIAPVPRAAGITDYQFKQGNYKETIPSERMLVKRRYDPRNRLNGVAPLAVALGSIDADSAQTDFIREFFNNGGTPNGILNIKGRKISQAEADEIRAKWRMRFGRLLGRQHDISVLDESATYQKVGAGLDELASQDIRSFTESRVSMVFDVPPLIIYAYVGLLRATYDNLKGAWENFWQASLKPMFENWSDFLTWNLLTDFVDREMIYAELIRLRWDYSNVEWLKESKDQIEARARENFAVGGITLNEFRQRIGEQSDPAGDYYLRPQTLIAHAAGEFPVTTPVPLTNVLTSGGKRLLLPAGVKAKAASRDDVQAKMQKKLKKLLAAQYEAAAAALEAA